MPLGSPGPLLQHRLYQPRPNPTQPFVTQLQPPMFPPPPHPKFKIVFSSRVLGTTVQYKESERQLHLTMRSTISKFWEESHQKMESLTKEPDMHSTSAGKTTESLTERFLSQTESKSPAHRGFAYLKSQVFPLGTQSFKAEIIKDKSHSVTESNPQPERYQTESQQLLAKPALHEATSTQIDQNLKWGTQWHSLSSLSGNSEPQQSFTQSLFPKFYKDSRTEENYLPSTQFPFIQTQQLSVHIEKTTMHPEQHLTTSTPPKTQSHPPPAQPPQSQEPSQGKETAPRQHSSLAAQTTITPFSSFSWSSKLSPVDHDGHFNISQQGGSVKSPNDTKPDNHTEWHRSNTSQSPMTSNDPRLVK